MSNIHCSALDSMLDAIREVTGSEKQAESTRKNIISLLEVVADHLGPLLEVALAQDEACEVAAEHDATALLRALASALRDLDTGLTDPIFEPYKHGANASLPWHVRASDAALVEAIRIYRRKYKITQNAAATRLAADLNAQGFQRRGVKLTGESLRRLKYR